MSRHLEAEFGGVEPETGAADAVDLGLDNRQVTDLDLDKASEQRPALVIQRPDHFLIEGARLPLDGKGSVQQLGDRNCPIPIPQS